jgi:hypothetical protein
MDHLSFFPHPQGEIEAGVKFPSGTLAAGLSTGPVHVDQAATEQRMFMNNLGEAGSGSAFWIGQVSSATHKEACQSNL